MKKKFIFITVLLIAFLLPVFQSSNTSAASGFKDVPSNHWAKKEIDYMIYRGVIKGYSDGTFKPNNNVTNAQVATMLVRALQLDTNGRPYPNFTDVYSTNPAFKEIATAVDVGIFPKGKTFNPNSPISRESMARAISNAFKLKADKPYNFSDVPNNYWAYNYISNLGANKITTGYEDGSFRPKGTVTRAQFSAFVARALNEDYKPKDISISVSGGKFYINGIRLGIKKQDVLKVLGNPDYKDYYDEGIEAERYRNLRNLGITYTMDNSKLVTTINFNFNRNDVGSDWFKKLGEPFRYENGTYYYYLEGSEDLLVLYPNEGQGWLSAADGNFYYHNGLEGKIYIGDTVWLRNPFLQDENGNYVRLKNLTKAYISNVTKHKLIDDWFVFLFKIDGKYYTSDIDPDLAFSEFYESNPYELYDWSREIWSQIENETISIGMTKDMVTMSWGAPDDINRTTGSWGTSEQWIYGGNISYRRYIYFDNGILTAIQD